MYVCVLCIFILMCNIVHTKKSLRFRVYGHTNMISDKIILVFRLRNHSGSDGASALHVRKAACPEQRRAKMPHV